ncbi:hypothetical protein ACKVB7_005496 [Klebsiella pneumoniae]|nr:hypothetical protein [Klebsiella pneumoniae]EKV5107477.1 hypothetical protein [Klebsiella pneumoniae]
MNYPTETLTSGNEQQAITSTKASTNTQNPASNNQLENQDITKTPSISTPSPPFLRLPFPAKNQNP